MKKILAFSVILIGTGAAIAADTKPETPAQVRRIVAQSICLAVAYPGSDIAKDSEAVYAVYAGMLPVKSPREARRRITELALKSAPAALSPVGNHNLALAKCTLFAERSDVLALLGAAKSRR